MLRNAKRQRVAGELGYAVTGSLFRMLDFLYYPVAAKALEPFDCVEMVSNSGANSTAEVLVVLEIEPSIRCGIGEYIRIEEWARFLLFPAILLWPVVHTWAVIRHNRTMRYIQDMRLRGIPLATATRLYHGDSTTNVTTRAARGSHLKRLRKVELLYDVMYSRFRPDVIWWGGVLLMRKVTIMVVMAAFSSSPIFQCVLLLVVLQLSLLGHMWY